MRRPAGPFANAERGGRQLQWTGLNVDADGAIGVPAVTFTSGGMDYNVFRIAPASGVLKGIATLERIRGWETIYWPEIAGIDPGPFGVWSSIQVVRLATIDTETFNTFTVSLFQQEDMDNISIMWQRYYTPRRIAVAGTSFTASESSWDQGNLDGNVDVRVKRRIDYSQFMVAKVLAAPTGSLVTLRSALWLRGLFRTMGAL